MPAEPFSDPDFPAFAQARPALDQEMNPCRITLWAESWARYFRSNIADVSALENLSAPSCEESMKRPSSSCDQAPPA